MKAFAIFMLFTFILMFFSCKKSTLDDGFNDANGNVKEKLLKRVTNQGNNENVEDFIFQFGYDGNNKLSSITDGNNTWFFNYDSQNNLTSISGSDEPFQINDLYQSPYDAFKDGNVLEYDDKGNPKKIQVYEDQNYNNPDYLLIGDISYDAKPNPFFYTLKAGGIVDVLNKVELNFGATSPSIIKAYQLMFYNNIQSIIFKNINGQVQSEIHFETTYDNDGYATNSTVTYLDKDGSSTNYITYIYK